VVESTLLILIVFLQTEGDSYDIAPSKRSRIVEGRAGISGKVDSADNSLFPRLMSLVSHICKYMPSFQVYSGGCNAQY
jgi:hypothetical protein